MRVTLTFRNDFHQRDCTVRASVYTGSENRLWLSRRQYRILRRLLCPSPDCTCASSSASGPGMAAAVAFVPVTSRADLYAVADRGEVEGLLARQGS